MLCDLIWLNAVIATELIQITGNTSMVPRLAGSPPKTCTTEHATLRATTLEIVDRYRPGTTLRQHVEKHK